MPGWSSSPGRHWRISSACRAEAGTDATRVLSVTIHIKDVDADFAGMNAVWDSWLPAGSAPARPTVEAQWCEPEILVEMSVAAALP